MPTADEILATASRRKRTEYVCLDGDLMSRYTAKRDEYKLLKDRQGNMLSDDDDLSDLAAEVEKLEAEVNAKIFPVTFVEVRPGRVAELRTDHALSRDEQKKQGSAIDVDAFLTTLACESVSEPEFNAEQMQRLLDNDEATRRQILSAVDELHGGKADPKALVGTGPRLNGEPS